MRDVIMVLSMIRFHPATLARGTDQSSFCYKKISGYTIIFKAATSSWVYVVDFKVPLVLVY
jgi:hypothetical protein